MPMRFRIEPRDVPLEVAARRLGKTRAEFEAALPDLIARGFPQPDPTPAISISPQSTDGAMLVTRTCSAVAAMQARDAATVAKERIAAMRQGDSRRGTHDPRKSSALRSETRPSLLAADQEDARAGFYSVPLGQDGPDAWALAEQWNERWDKTRRGEAPSPAMARRTISPRSDPRN